MGHCLKVDTRLLLGSDPPCSKISALASCFLLYAVLFSSICRNTDQSPNLKTYKDPKNRFQGINSAGLFSMAGPVR
jgi:hypothetical protein